MAENLIIVFDIGGTWFRSGLFSESKQLIEVSRQPAVNFKNHVNLSVREMQNALVQYILSEIHRYAKKYTNHEIRTLGISMGAALNAHSGYIYNSGPLWGPKCKPFDLLPILQSELQKFQIYILNDVTAALYREIQELKDKGISQLMLITISSGIACRIYDLKTKKVPVDKLYGLQGEIGHLPTTFYYDKELINLPCDCGGDNHLNAYSSGRGIIYLIRELLLRKIVNFPISHDMGDNEIFQSYVKLVSDKNKTASKLLDKAIEPIAKIIETSITLNPQIEKIILTGGVVHSLNPHYLNRLKKLLDTDGAYQISQHDPNYLSSKIFEGSNDDNSGLIGAAFSIIHK